MAHWNVPEEFSFSTKKSVLPAEVTSPPPKSTVPWKLPVIYELLEESTAMSHPRSSEVEPYVFTHWNVPEEFSFNTKMSMLPAEVTSPPPKSTVPWKFPVMYELPEESTAIRYPASEEVEP